MTARARHLIALGLLIRALAPPALAQPVSDAELSDAAARAAQAVQQAEQKISHGTTALPHIDALPAPSVHARSAVDIEAIARRMQAQTERAHSPELLAFVSFSMPKMSLERLIRDAERTGAILVVRGMVNGTLDATFAKANEFIGDRPVRWILDPRLFRRYGVTSVPTYVLSREADIDDTACAIDVCPESAFVKLAGDVTVNYALETIERLAPEFGTMAAMLRMREHP